MTQNIDPIETARLQVLGAVLALQHTSGKTEHMFTIPGTGQVVAVGTPAEVAQLLELAPESDLTTAECPTCRGDGVVVLTGRFNTSAVACDDCHGQGRVIVSRKDMAALAQQQTAQPLDDSEVARLRRVVNAVGMQREVPEDDATLRGCLFSVLGMIARKLEQRPCAAETVGRAPGIPDGVTGLPLDTVTGSDIAQIEAFKTERFYLAGDVESARRAALAQQPKEGADDSHDPIDDLVDVIERDAKPLRPDAPDHVHVEAEDTEGGSHD